MREWQHKDLAERWKNMPLREQMLNIGSKLSRTLKWKNKGNKEYMEKSFFLVLELIDMTIDTGKYNYKEFTRLREILCDFILGKNEYNISDNIINYFTKFAE